jgi:hypothetical protein
VPISVEKLSLRTRHLDTRYGEKTGRAIFPEGKTLSLRTVANRSESTDVELLSHHEGVNVSEYIAHRFLAGHHGVVHRSGILPDLSRNVFSLGHSLITCTDNFRFLGLMDALEC